MRLEVVFIPVVRPLFRGGRLGLEARMATTLGELEKPLGFRLVLGEAVVDREGALRMAQWVAGAQPDLLVLGLVTFATGETLEPLLSLPFPKLLWALPEAWEGGPLPQNALCGLNLALSLPSLQPPAKWAYGPPHGEGLGPALEATLKALRGLRVLRSARLLWIGGPAPGFTAFVELPRTGARVEEVSLEDLFLAFDSVPEREVAEALGLWDEPGEVTPEARRALARMALALERLAHGYDGVALRDWPEIPERLGLVPAAALAHLSEKGITVAPEGDLMGLLSQLVLQALGEGPALLVDLVAAGPKGLLLWHGGEAHRAWAQGPFRLLPHFNRGLPAVRDMVLKEGPVTGMRLWGEKVAILGGRLTGQGGYEGCSGWLQEPRWGRQPVEPERLLGHWLGARLPHHLAIVQGDQALALEELALWAGLVPLGLPPKEGVWGVSWR